MSGCCCFDEPLFVLNALSKDRNTDKLIILTNYCYEVSFARVNCMRLLNFSLFRFLQLKAKGGFWFPDFGMPSRLAEPQEGNVYFLEKSVVCDLEMTGLHQDFPKVIQRLESKNAFFRNLIFTCQLPCSFNDWPWVGKVKVRLPVYFEPSSLQYQCYLIFFPQIFGHVPYIS